MITSLSSYLKIGLTLVAVFISANVSAQHADAILGRWIASNGDSNVEIYKCGSKYCAKIIWLKNPLETDGSGKPNLDDKNEDPKLRTRPVMGLVIMTGFVYDGENRWKDGTIYNPKDGKTYSCKMTLLDNENLDVRGYVGISLFGKTQRWVRIKS